MFDFLRFVFIDFFFDCLDKTLWLLRLEFDNFDPFADASRDDVIIEELSEYKGLLLPILLTDDLLLFDLLSDRLDFLDNYKLRDDLDEEIFPTLSVSTLIPGGFIIVGDI